MTREKKKERKLAIEEFRRKRQLEFDESRKVLRSDSLFDEDGVPLVAFGVNGRRRLRVDYGHLNVANVAEEVVAQMNWIDRAANALVNEEQAIEAGGR